MKFQNVSQQVLNGRTEGRTDKSKAICPYNFSKVGNAFPISKHCNRLQPSGSTPTLWSIAGNVGLSIYSARCFLLFFFVSY